MSLDHARRRAPAIGGVIGRCLEKDPARRFGNVGELASALAPFARLQAQASIAVQRINRALGSASFPVLHQQATSANPSTLTSSSGQFGRAPAATMPNGRKSKTGVIAGVSALAIIVVALIGFAVMQGRKQTTKAVTPVEPTQPTPTEVPPPAPPPAAATAPPDAPVAAPPDAAAPVVAPPDASETAAPPDAPPDAPKRKKKTKGSDDLMDQRT